MANYLLYDKLFIFCIPNHNKSYSIKLKELGSKILNITQNNAMGLLIYRKFSIHEKNENYKAIFISKE